MKIKKLMLVLSATFLSLGSISSCANSNPNIEGIKEVYKLAIKDGYDGTYEEWIESIKNDASKTNVDIVSIILKTSEDEYDVYEVSYSDGTKSQLKLKGPKGDKGDKGDKGEAGDKGPTGDKGETGDKGQTGDKGEAGDKGQTGDKGETGDQGPTGEAGSQGSKGEDGDKGETGNKGDQGDSPYIGENGNWWIGDKDTGTPALGENVETCHVKFLVDGKIYEEKDVIVGRNMLKPKKDPVKEGYIFLGWYLNDTKWFFEGYSVNYDLSLEAKFKVDSEVKTYEISLDKGAGELDVTKPVVVTNHKEFTLPVPVAPEGYEFEGWYHNDTKITGNNGKSLDVFAFGTNINAVAKYTKIETSPDAQTKHTLTMDFSGTHGVAGLPTTSTDSTFSKEGITFKGNGVYLNGSYLFIKNTKSFYNETSFGKLISINVQTTGSMSTSAKLEILGSKTTNFDGAVELYNKVIGQNANETITIPADSGITHVKFSSVVSNVQVSKLTFVYEKAGGSVDPTPGPDVDQGGGETEGEGEHGGNTDPVDPNGLNSYYGTQSEREQLVKLKGKSLKDKLHKITSRVNNVGSYDDLWTYYKSTDVREDGTVWDMYGEYHFKFGSKQGANYKVPGDAYNREHSVPKSWFKDAKPMHNDLWHLYPTDGKINNTRGNWEFGDVSDLVSLNPNMVGDPVGNREGNEFGDIDPKWKSYKNSPSTVFEPREIYKGDFARTYFMMATLYQDKIANGPFESGHAFALNTYPSLTDYSLNLFMEWAKNDPVSPKEIARNEAVFKIQGSRNPFIDCPSFADAIWGDLVH